MDLMSMASHQTLKFKKKTKNKNKRCKSIIEDTEQLSSTFDTIQHFKNML